MEVSEAVEVGKTIGVLLPNTVTSVDGVVSAIVNVFNDILLYPVKKASLTFKYKFEQFSADLAKEIASRNVRNIKPVDLAIVGPTIEAMRYSLDVEELRKMYIRLLATAVDEDVADNVHPSFVEIIKRMNVVDAKIFKSLTRERGHVLVANPRISIKGTGRYFVDATPEWYMASLEAQGFELFASSSSLVRLSKFGLIDLMYDRTAGEERCDWVLQSADLKRTLSIYQANNASQTLELVWTDSILRLNDYGKQFAKACL